MSAGPTVYRMLMQESEVEVDRFIDREFSRTLERYVVPDGHRVILELVRDAGRVGYVNGLNEGYSQAARLFGERETAGVQDD